MNARRLVLGLALCVTGATAADTSPSSAPSSAHSSAAAADPLRSEACRSAMEALAAQEATQRPARASDATQAAPADAPIAGDTASASARAPHDARAPLAPDPRLEASRRHAAIACLASQPDPATRPQPQAPASRFAQPPLAVPPITLAAPPATALPHPTPLMPIVPLSPPPVPRPQFITACDAGGCWANDGSRLNRVGPNLSAGSRGLCVQQGNLLTCP